MSALDPTRAAEVGQQLLDAVREPPAPRPPELVEPEAGWSNACPHCMAPIKGEQRQVGGEPVPEGMREQLARGEAVMENCVPQTIKRIRLRCLNGHEFDVTETQRDQARRFQLKFRGVHRRLPDDFRGLTEPGWPRPRYRLMRDRGGRMIDVVLPVPWVTPVPRFSQTDPQRRMESKANKLCQVCGFAHKPGAEVIVFLNGGLLTSDGKPMDRERYFNAILRAIDDSVMHERCAKLAAGSCPQLKAMRASGDLWSFAGPIEAVELFDDRDKPIAYPPGQREAAKVELPKYETYLALHGARARVFEL